MKWSGLEERLPRLLYKAPGAWGHFIDRDNAYHTVCVPSAFREVVRGRQLGPPPPTLPSVCLEVLSGCVTRQAGETVWAAPGGGRGYGEGGGPGCLCGISQCRGCPCQEETSTCQSGDVFRLGAAWSPSGARIRTQLVFCCAEEPPRGNSYSEH